MNADLAELAQAALARTGAASSAILVFDAAGKLVLGAASGISGEPLERLLEAVQSPDHPVARTGREAQAGFDVTPIAPGGPALRSHVPLLVADEPGRSVGVLALAHQLPLTEEQRDQAFALASEAAQLAAQRVG